MQSQGKYAQAEQGRRLIQFLIGLNEIGTLIRGSILMMNPLPSIAQAFSLLIQEKRQREIRPSNHLALESAALNASTSRPNSFGTNYSPNNNHNNRTRPFCNYCKRPGHTKEKYYKPHGYPQNLNQNQNPNISHRFPTSIKIQEKISVIVIIIVVIIILSSTEEIQQWPMHML